MFKYTILHVFIQKKNKNLNDVFRLRRMKDDEESEELKEAMRYMVILFKTVG
ncbi:hypothetical protein KEJ33_06300 [Candidatus Bathyarchaeota archaeon]|nr:hypothetical protein [Candidatus Bathyarchaeota archaeon]